MKPVITRSPLSGVLSAAAALALGAACLGVGSAAMTRPALTSPAHQIQVQPNSNCGSKTESINPAGGAFTIPPCNGTKGKVTYGTNNANNNTVTLQSAASNPAPSICGTASGETTLAYVLATGNGAGSITYNPTSKKSTLKNAAFPPSLTFTLYAYAFGVEQFHQSLGSPNNKGVLKFSSPLNGMTIPLGITLCFELDTP
jgi:hypothetical protein